MDENNYIEKQLSDHEVRIRRLEESDIQQRIQLTNIEKSQSDIKLMMSEQSKEQIKQTREQQEMLNNFTTQMINYFKEKENKELETEKENNKSNNEIKFYNTKQFWGIVSAIVTGVLMYFGLK